MSSSLTMSSEVFEQLEEDIRKTTEDLAHKIDSRIPRLNGEERKKAIREAENTFEDAFITIEDMEVEVRKAPQPYRNQLTVKVRKCRDDLNKLQTKLRQINATSSTFMRQELFASEGSNQPTNLVAGQRSRLHQTNSILERTSGSIARSQQVAVETEQIGNEIITEMGDQRDSLLRTREHLSGTDANLMQSRKILKTMYIRVMTNKMILVFIILLELGILAGVVYWKFFK